jgi:hypothetical protein
MKCGSLPDVATPFRKSIGAAVRVRWFGSGTAITRFISDMIGPGIVGHWWRRGNEHSDPTEHLRIEGRHVKPRNGRLSFRFAEVMEELVYLDRYGSSPSTIRRILMFIPTNVSRRAAVSRIQDCGEP